MVELYYIYKFKGSMFKVYVDTITEIFYIYLLNLFIIQLTLF